MQLSEIKLGYTDGAQEARMENFTSLFYEDDEDGLHCFNPNEDPLKMFNEIKNKALIILKEEEKELEFFKEGFVVV